MNVDYNHAILTAKNEVTLITDGKEKFKQLIQDIESATDHIHIQYYIFKMDETGRAIYQALVKKAQEGISVKFLYDDLGSRKLGHSDFKEFIAAGGEVGAFFPSYLKIPSPVVPNQRLPALSCSPQCTLSPSIRLWDLIKFCTLADAIFVTFSFVDPFSIFPPQDVLIIISIIKERIRI